MPIITEGIGNVWVLWWKPSDGKGDGNVKRAYEDETRANEDYNLVKGHPIRTYFRTSILFYKSRFEPSAIENMKDVVGVWVLWWSPLNGEGAGCIERVYEEEGRANEDFALVEDHPTNKYFLDNILLYRRPVDIEKWVTIKE